MRILLPPSEAKRPGGRGKPLGAGAPVSPLAHARRPVLDAVTALAAGGDLDSAAQLLLLPPSVAADALAANAAVWSSRTMPAIRRYAGVVYAGLDYPQLTRPAQRLAGHATLIFSGLFGVLRGGEPVPNYRVPAKARLPGLGALSRYWRTELTESVPALIGDGPVVDLRSSDYAALWRPRGELAARTITVKVLSPVPRGGHAVVSYASKLAKGRLSAALLERRASGLPVAGVDDVAAAWHACGGGRTRAGGSGELVIFTA